MRKLCWAISSNNSEAAAFTEFPCRAIRVYSYLPLPGPQSTFTASSSLERFICVVSLPSSLSAFWSCPAHRRTGLWPTDRNSPTSRTWRGRPTSWWTVNGCCGRVGIPGNQGISVGYADTYFKFLGGQYFVLDGGDGQAPIPPGQYIIRITVNPPFTAAAGEPCPHIDLSGFCHQLPESNFTNNVAEVLITIPDPNGKTGFGPGAGNITNTELIDDENRPDK